MNSLMSATVSMTSREIAELTGKRHDHVLRDIDNLLKTLSPELGNGFKSSTYVSGDPPREYRQFELDRDSTYCLVAGYDANVRMKIIKRWQELEASQTKQMSPAEILIYQGQLMLAIEQEQLRQAEAQRLLEQRQDATEQRQDATEQRLDQIETASDHFTILGWYRYTNQQGSLTLPEAAQMGRKATKYCKSHEVPLGQVPDPRFGTANTYPKWVLEHLFANSEAIH